MQEVLQAGLGPCLLKSCQEKLKEIKTIDIDTVPGRPYGGFSGGWGMKYGGIYKKYSTDFGDFLRLKRHF